MSQGPDAPNWLAWIGPIGVAVGGFFTLMKSMFVTYGQLRKALADMETRREEREDMKHQENLQNFTGVFERLSKLEQSHARTEGMLSGRYPRIER